jgi:hypothetical protein
MRLSSAYELANMMLQLGKNSSTPVTLIAGIDKRLATEICQELTAIGITASYEVTDINSVMLLQPKATHRYRWGKLKTLRLA